MKEDEESFQKEWRGASFITAQPATEFEFEKISTINAARFQKAFAGGGTLKVKERWEYRKVFHFPLCFMKYFSQHPHVASNSIFITSL